MRDLLTRKGVPAETSNHICTLLEDGDINKIDETQERVINMLSYLDVSAPQNTGGLVSNTLNSSTSTLFRSSSKLTNNDFVEKERKKTLKRLIYPI